MKKTKSFLPILLAIGTLAALASCGAKTECPTCSSCETCSEAEQTTHAHTKAETYSYDENGHYHECAGCKENVRFDYEEHSFVEKNGINTCSVCGYVENQDMEEFFKSFKKAIEAYEADKTQTTNVTFSNSEKEGGIDTYGYVSTGKMSIDLERNLYFEEVVNTNTYYDEEGKVSNEETTKNGGAYIKDGDTYSYYNYSSDDKETLKTDTYMVQKRYNENYLMTGYFSPLEYSYLANFADYEKVINKSYTAGGYDHASIKHSLKSVDGGYEYKLDIEQRNSYTSQLRTYTENYTIIIKNDSFVSFASTSNTKYKYINETTITNESNYSYDISVSYDFDQTSYDAFDKTDYEDKGNGERFYCTYYYGDYEIGEARVEIGKVLSSNTYVSGAVTYGDIYCDKEFTKKYDGETINGNMDKMYVKPTVKEGSYAKVVLLTEKTYIDPDGIEENRVYSDWSSGRDVEITEGETNYFYVTYDLVDGYKMGKMYVNGELLEGDKFEVEAGKIYIVEYKRNCYQ